MRNSPIHLNSSLKAKQKATRSPSVHTDESSVLANENSRVTSSIHQISAKLSPNKIIDPNLILDGKYTSNPQTQSIILTRTVRPTVIRSPFNKIDILTNTRCSQSFYDLQRPQVIKIQRSILRQSDSKENESYSPFKKLSQSNITNSPIKEIMESERGFIKIELEKPMSTVKFSGPTPRFTCPVESLIRPISNLISSPKVVKQVFCKSSPKEIELERKVRILEMRIGEIHQEKNLIETRMHEMNIRLQHENNFLKEKLNSFPSFNNIHSFKNLNMNKTVETQDYQESNGVQLKALHASYPQKCQPNLPEVKSKLKFSKSSQSFFHKSRETQSIKQQLLETEEMLSKEIDKSLKLLEELSAKQRENEEMKSQLKMLKQKVDSLHSLSQYKIVFPSDSKLQDLQSFNNDLQFKIKSLENDFLKLNQQVECKTSLIQNLQRKLQQLQRESGQNMVPRMLFEEMQQNNRILLSAVNSLQNCVSESQDQLRISDKEKGRLQEKVIELQSKVSDLEEKLQQSLHLSKQRQNAYDYLEMSMKELQAQLNKITEKLEALNLQEKEKNRSLSETKRSLEEKSLKVERLQQKIHQLSSNYSSSHADCYPKGPETNNCRKCDELRKTIIKLNNYLNGSTGFTRDSILL